MSTRGTYEIKHRAGKQCFYIHHDNYESGAAHYFWQMHRTKTKQDCLATRFIAGNPLHVEFTHAHDSHGDTEYRYNLEANGELQALKEYFGTWEVIFYGHYAEFINKHLPEIFGREYNHKEHHLLEYQHSPHPFTDEKRSEWLTINDLKNRAAEFYRDSLSTTAHPDFKANALKHANDIQAFLLLNVKG